MKNNEANEPSSRVHVQKSREFLKSLSTITEETKSATTTSCKSERNLSKGSLVPNAGFLRHSTQIIPKPSSPDSVRSRLREHSVILRHTSQEVTLPRDLQKTESLQKRLLSHISASGKPLFRTVVTENPAYKTPSILVSGCGLRNVESLQEALKIEEEHRLKELYRNQGDRSSSSRSSTSNLGSSSETQTEKSMEDGVKQKLMYLMGLKEGGGGGEEEDELGRAGGEEEELEEIGFGEFVHEAGPDSLTLAMRKAQKYLRAHRIFEFFQFIVAHLLSALPENPIEFIIELLDRCLMYRSGLGEPPVLYDKKHLECLFYLMDKMRTGSIELEQYRTGMQTLGICCYNKTPPLTPEGTVRKEDFIEEAYECLSNLLADVLRRRWLNKPAPNTHPVPPTPQISPASSTSSSECQTLTNLTKTRYFVT